MAKVNLKVEVSEGAAEDQRIFSVTVMVPAKDYMLADLLSQRGVMPGLGAQLRQAARETAEGYLSGAEGLIAGIGTMQKEPAAPPKVEVVTAKPKAVTAPKVPKQAKPKPENGTGEAQETAQGIEQETHSMAAAASGD